MAQQVRYIGKTKSPKSRYRAHITSAQSRATNHHCARWIRRLLRNNLAPEFEIVYEVPDGENWQEAEMRLISEYRALGHRLTNMTAGGDGFHDVHPEVIRKRVAKYRVYMSAHADEINKRLREANARPEARAAKSASIKAVWANPEHRSTYLAALQSPEARTNRRMAMLSRYADPAVIERHKANMKAIWSTDNRRAEARARSIAMHANKEQSERRKASLRVVMSTTEYRQKMSAISVKTSNRPEVKAAKSKSMKSAWTRPEYRAKILNSTGRSAKLSECARANWNRNRDSMMAAMNGLDRCEKLSISMSRRNADPEFRRLMSDPEMIARRNASIKEAWRRRKLEVQINA